MLGSLSWFGCSRARIERLAFNLERRGLRVVAVLLSGRPLIINDALAKCDAFVAAWLPGAEGQGGGGCLVWGLPTDWETIAIMASFDGTNTLACWG